MSLARRSTCSNTWPMFSNKLLSKYCLTGKTHQPSENTKIAFETPKYECLFHGRYNYYFFYPILNGNAFSYSPLTKRLCCHRNTKIKVVKILVPEWRKMDHHLFLPRVLYFQSERLYRPQMSAYTAFFVWLRPRCCIGDLRRSTADKNWHFLDVIKCWIKLKFRSKIVFNISYFSTSKVLNS